MRPEATDQPAAGGESRDRPAAHAQALGRIATLVAEGAGPDRMFAAVATEVCRVLGVPSVLLGRYGADGTMTVLAAPMTSGFRIGTRWVLDGPSLAAQILETGRPARIDDYASVKGGVAQAARDLALRSAVGVPVVLDGALWGLITAATSAAEPLPPDTEEQLAGFTELMAIAISHAETHDRLRRLSDERDAVRRVAALATAGAPSADLFAVVVREVVQLLGVSGGALLRYETGRAVTVLASLGFPAVVLGSRYPLDGPSLAAEILETGRSARIDDYADLDGAIAETMLTAGFRSAFGVPVTVDGEAWGLIGVGTKRAEELPADADVRLRDFTELLAGAISNAEARERLRRLAEGQAALRRLATLVAEGGSSAELVAAVVAEIEAVLDVHAIALLRYEPDRSATVVASHNGAIAVPGDATGFSVGSRVPLDAPSIFATVLDTARPARADGFVGVPVVVDGRVWGACIVGSRDPDPLPAGLEDRLREFAELVAIAISNAESRARRIRLAEQQAALRRVATLAAEDATPEALFAAVAEEVVRTADVSAVTVSRLDLDGHAVVLASFNDPGFPVGSRWPPEPDSLQAQVRETGRPARIDDYDGRTGSVAEAARASGTRSAVGAPIVVDGAIWGMLAAGVRQRRDALPTFAGSYTGRLVLAAESTQDVEARLAPFTELAAIAIAKAQTRDDLRRLAEEQAALRRVATRVAEGALPSEIFAAVVDEIAGILGLQGIEMARYEPDGTATVIGASGDHPFPAGSAWTLDEPSVMAAVSQTSRPARIDDYSILPGTIAERVLAAGFRSAIGAPIVVDGATWGAIIAFSTQPERIPERAETRLSQFTELVATAVSNATARADLIASRARIVAAGDQARRRFERNLHDGTQQRLLAVGLDLQRIRAELDAEAQAARDGLEQAERDLGVVLEEVREVSRGLHPPQLARAGLPAALKGLARRSPIPVELAIDVGERPPEPVETAVYYVVSEALTNAIKHSRATVVSVTVTRAQTALRVAIADDGVGGAVAGDGSGLTGLSDRIAAAGGRLTIDSPRGRGTTIAFEVPLLMPAAS
jgi:signal transduction histidine kinase